MSELFRCHILLLAVLLVNIVIASNNENKATLTVPFSETPPKLSNFLSMRPEGEAERGMSKVSGFTQFSPDDGQPSREQTDVYISHDDKNLYVVFVAFDSEPDKIRGQMSRREKIQNDDQIEILLDTYNDKRRAFAFITNPLGVQWDALWTEGSGFDDSWDTVWHSNGEVTEQGYVVFISIPFKSLRFEAAPEQNWGVIFLRVIKRGKVEKSFWPRVSAMVEGRLNQAATLEISKKISPGRNIQLIPYANYRSFRVLDDDRFVTDNIDPDIGLDAKFVVRENLAIDATINPDFSQVESDRPQRTVNKRFEVFFPEKRPFFLENANFFNTPTNLVFTRRIAEPQFGARVTGKIGEYALGALVVDDRAAGKRFAKDDPLSSKRAFFGIARVNRDIFKQSSIGLLYTDREFEDSYNRVFSVDSRLKLNQNWRANAQGMYSKTQNLDGKSFGGTAFEISLNQNNRFWVNHSHFLSFEDDFQTQTGFVNRSGIRNLHQFFSYSFWPEDKFLVKWGPEIFLLGIWDHSGTRLDQRMQTSIEAEFPGRTEVKLNYSNIRERLRPDDFSMLLQNKDFDTSQWLLEFQTFFLDEIGIQAEIGWGNAINFAPLATQAPQPAKVFSSEFLLTLRPLRSLSIISTYLFFRLKDKQTSDKIFDNSILSSRWNWQFNRNISVRFILNYDVTSTNNAYTDEPTEKNLNLDFLITYLVNPWTAFHAGVNSNYQNLNFVRNGSSRNLIRTTNDFLNDGRQFFVKYSYLFRP